MDLLLGTTSGAALTVSTGWCTWRAVATAGTAGRAARAGVAGPRSCPPRTGLPRAGRPRCCPPTPPPARCGTPPTTCCCPTAPATCGPAHGQSRIPAPGSPSPDDSSCRPCSPTCCAWASRDACCSSAQARVPPASCCTRTQRDAHCGPTASESPRSRTRAGSSTARPEPAALLLPRSRASDTLTGEALLRSHASESIPPSRGSATSARTCTRTSARRCSYSSTYSTPRSWRRKACGHRARARSGMRCTRQARRCATAWRACAPRSRQHAWPTARWRGRSGCR